MDDCRTEIKADCARCGGLRNCDVRGSYKESGGDDDTAFSWEVTWRILSCKGCDYVFAQTVSTNSEEYENYYEPDGSVGTEPIATVRYWPALAKRARPEWMFPTGLDVDRSGKLHIVLLELYTALDNDLNMLAAVGIRTSFDVASTLLDIDADKTFAGKLESLVAGGHIGIVDKNRLQALVDAGSASAHRGWRPSPDDLQTMMAILEHFLNAAFVAPASTKMLDTKATAMKAKVPPRQRT